MRWAQAMKRGPVIVLLLLTLMCLAVLASWGPDLPTR
jgi:hypothetical protein